MNSSHMGRNQKLKAMRKKAKMEQAQSGESMKKRMTLYVGVLLVLGVVGAGGWFMMGNNGGNEESVNTEENVKDISDLVEITQIPVENNKIAVLQTNQGTIKIRLFEDGAPKTVENFVKLASEGFYDGVKFHRVIKDFMIQSGDPNSKDDDWSNDGTGGPGYTFDDEQNEYKNIRGRISMANSGPNTNGSQFFIITADATPWLDGKHTVFGEIIEGLDVMDTIENVAVNGNDHPLEDMTIEKVSIEESS